jgi:copper chaperone NosL
MRICSSALSRPLRHVSALWLAVVALALLAASCKPGAVPIAYGQDSCAYCRMQISDPRYGGELITRTGKVLKFDSIECLASYYSGLSDPSTVRSTWVSDYRNPGTLVPADGAIYIQRAGARSPMGRGLLAVRAGAVAAGSDVSGAAGPLEGDTLSWAGVVALMQQDSLMQDAVPSRATPIVYRAADVRPH